MFRRLRSLVKQLSWGSAGSAASGSGLDVVGSRGEGKRRPARIETKDEDDLVPASQRLKVLNLTRDGMRNAPHVRAIVQQLRVLTVGLQGGTLTCCTENNEWNDEAQRAFKEHTRHIDFIDGTGLNDCLKLVLTALAAEGGDLVMLFDDGILSGKNGTGKIRFFESDNIANLDPTEFEKRFGKEWKQSQGLIYNNLGRFVGVVVSGKKRGKRTFKKDECFTLVRDPDAPVYDAPWTFIKRKWRLLQGRGISPQTVAIAALLDMYELVGSEVQSGKLNSKIVAQVIDSMDVSDGIDGDEDIGDGVADIDHDNADDGDVSGGDSDGLGNSGETEVDFDVTQFESTTGGITLNPPAGTKLDILDLKRPNDKLIQFIEWMNGGAAAVHGMARVYAGLKAETSYTAFRGEQTISWASIEESQKELERLVCDWIAVKVIRWLIDNGRLSAGPEGWESCMSWSWPDMREVNEVDAQNAKSTKLKNFLTTYRMLLGPNWQSILSQVSEEVQWFQQNGLIHPSQQTVSGQVVDVNNNGSTPETRGGDKEE